MDSFPVPPSDPVTRRNLCASQSTVAVWALLMGSAFFFVGLLWFLEALAATMRAYALRDRIRTLLLLSTLFFFAWLIAGNVWWAAHQNTRPLHTAARSRIFMPGPRLVAGLSGTSGRWASCRPTARTGTWATETSTTFASS